MAWTETRKVKVIPTAFEVQRKLLRRTPGLRVLEEAEGILQVMGITLASRDGEWYEAGELYQKLEVYEPAPIVFYRVGEEVRAERVPVVGRARLTPPREEAPREPSPPPQEEAAPPKKRVRIGSFETDRGKPEGVDPSLREVHRLLWELLGGEEFAPEGVNAYLEHRRLNPTQIWRSLEAQGWLVREKGFCRLRSPGNLLAKGWG